MLVRTEKGKFEDVVGKMKSIPGVKVVFPVLGRYDVVVDIETASGKELGKVSSKVNRLAGVVFTETLPEVEGS
ncbi:MAG: Lrp/AsnC ligand binding domain-containing protein [Nitrososphaerota archaeon]|jgi:DNA-binding Lrp family transcriptional regulator|nr:Lrp/AsnC ligand binding domain-containing protein [Nitrososphaerota archaeon]